MTETDTKTETVSVIFTETETTDLAIFEQFVEEMDFRKKEKNLTFV